MEASSSLNESPSMLRSDSSERLHQFDLHGYLVFDDYIPISCPPSKGVSAPLVILTVQSSLLEREIASSSDMVDSTENSASPLSHSSSTLIDEIEKVGGEPAIYVLPIKVPFTILQDLNSNAIDAKKASNWAPEALQRLAENLIQNRRQWIEKLVKPEHQDQPSTAPISPRNTKPHVTGNEKTVQENSVREISIAKTSDEDIDEDMDEESPELDRAEYMGEVEHVAEFLSLLAGSPEPPSHREETRNWLENVMTILQRMESMGCFAVVLVAEILDDDARSQGLDTKDKIDQFLEKINLADHLPKEFREKLRMPAVFCAVAELPFRQIFAAHATGGVSQGAITPIPLKPGDHIYTEIREKGALKYVKHHGIYTGNGRIIHFSGNEFSVKGLLFGGQKTARIRTTSIVKFMKHGRRLKIRKYVECASRDATIHSAETALVEQTYANYNLFHNNCEHFCHWCKTGKRSSKQVERGVQYAAAAGTVLATAAALGVALALKSE